MKIIFFGDSATDSKRIRTSNEAGRIPETYSIEPNTYGNGYVFLTAAQLFYEKPQYYQILNRGIGGDRLPQLYARIQLDVWNEKPDVLNILVGANDMVGEGNPNPTDLKRWGRLYRIMIEETLERLPDIKIIICEPFCMREEKRHLLKPYAEEARKIAEEFNLPFVALQEKLEKLIDVYGLYNAFYDGGHPNIVASKVISDEWIRVFKEQVIKE